MKEPDPARRALLRAAVAAPLAAALVSAAEARDYTSAAEVMGEIDRLEADVDGRLAAIASALPAALPFARSVAADHASFRRDRATLRRRLGLGDASPSRAPARAPSLRLDDLRAAAQDLVHAHAEGLPALGLATVVDALARHMVENARHLTVIDLWKETEDDRG